MTGTCSSDKANGAPAIGEIVGLVEPIDELAMTLVEELARGGDSVAWVDLNEGEREFYRMCVEALVVKWGLIKKAHDYLTVRL